MTAGGGTTGAGGAGGGTTGPRAYAVVDIDGVLADVRHRLHHLHRRPKDWHAFFATAAEDPVLPEGVSVVRRLRQDCEIVYLTGRPERLRRVTADWLAAAGLPDGPVRMRGEGDRRPARVLKVEALRALSHERPVAVLVDDDPDVAAAARVAGFAVFLADWARPDVQLRRAQEGDGRT